MRHLSTETLARIADGPATDRERAHLDECPDCRAELDALSDQLAAVADLPPPPLPAEVRDRIGDAVVARRAGAAKPPSRPYGRWALQAAAALALFVGGTAVGTRLDREPPTVAERSIADGAPAEETPPAIATAASPDTAGETTPEPALVERDPAGAARPTELARSSNTDRSADRGPARRPTPADPAATLREAEARYVEALARYVDERGGPVGGDPTNRLAALEGILYTTRAALDASPDDPVLEGFYRSALAQREAMLDDVTLTTAQAVY